MPLPTEAGRGPEPKSAKVQRGLIFPLRDSLRPRSSLEASRVTAEERGSASDPRKPAVSGRQPESPSDLSACLVQEVPADEKRRPPRKLIQHGQHLLRRTLPRSDAPEYNADRSVNFEPDPTPYQSSGAIVRQKHGITHSRQERQASGLAGIQRKRPSEGDHDGVDALRLSLPCQKGLRQGTRTMLQDFSPNALGHENRGGIREQVKAAKLIQMNDRSGVANDRLSHLP